jgi:simple sugar transport system permease protein
MNARLILVSVLAAMCLIIYGFNHVFGTSGNIYNVLRQTAPTLIVAIGMTFVIATGGIDLSVGSVAAVSGIVTAMLLRQRLEWSAVILIVLVFGLIIGVTNGLAITAGGVTPFIATLATMGILHGIAQVMTDASTISIPTGSAISLLGRGAVFGMPAPALIALGVVCVGTVTLRSTVIGRRVMAVGGNEVAARYSGIDIGRVRCSAYAISGALAALAGIIMVARMGSGSSYAGVGMELDVISAVVLGGANLFGGHATITGAVLGTLILGILSNGTVLLHISPYYIEIVRGVVIVAALMIAVESKQMANK